jgi:hypothetical protein
MSKVLVNETSLAGIADAIRGKNGTSVTYKPSEMAEAIISLPTGGGNDIPSETAVVADYWNYNGHNDWFINLKKPMKITHTWTTSAVISLFDSAENTVDASHLTFIIPPGLGTKAFNKCAKLQVLPKIYISDQASGANCSYMFYGCSRLKSIPEDFFRLKNENGELLDGYFPYSFTSSGLNNFFYGCSSLRKHPEIHAPIAVGNGNYNSIFYSCYVLDEITTIPVPFSASLATTSNKFTNTFDRCHRVKRIKFNTLENGSPYPAKWSKQTINLTDSVGYAAYDSNITSYNSGITTATKVTDAASYEALKNNPDWWTADVNFSRYNHDSAVETINSLPDTAAAGGSGNTITFKGESGASTDGGAINTLTEAEIAVATAKGWTVSLV